MVHPISQQISSNISSWIPWGIVIEILLRIIFGILSKCIFKNQWYIFSRRSFKFHITNYHVFVISSGNFFRYRIHLLISFLRIFSRFPQWNSYKEFIKISSRDIFEKNSASVPRVKNQTKSKLQMISRRWSPVTLIKSARRSSLTRLLLLQVLEW